MASTLTANALANAAAVVVGMAAGKSMDMTGTHHVDLDNDANRATTISSCAAPSFAVSIFGGDATTINSYHARSNQAHAFIGYCLFVLVFSWSLHLIDGMSARRAHLASSFMQLVMGVYLLSWLFFFLYPQDLAALHDYVLRDIMQHQHLAIALLMIACSAIEYLQLSYAHMSRAWNVLAMLDLTLIGLIFMCHPQHDYTGTVRHLVLGSCVVIASFMYGRSKEFTLAELHAVAAIEKDPQRALQFVMSSRAAAGTAAAAVPVKLASDASSSSSSSSSSSQHEQQLQLQHTLRMWNVAAWTPSAVAAHVDMHRIPTLVPLVAPPSTSKSTDPDSSSPDNSNAAHSASSASSSSSRRNARTRAGAAASIARPIEPARGDRIVLNWDIVGSGVFLLTAAVLLVAFPEPDVIGLHHGLSASCHAAFPLTFFGDAVAVVSIIAALAALASELRNDRRRQRRRQQQQQQVGSRTSSAASDEDADDGDEDEDDTSGGSVDDRERRVRRRLHARDSWFWTLVDRVLCLTPLHERKQQIRTELGLAGDDDDDDVVVDAKRSTAGRRRRSRTSMQQSKQQSKQQQQLGQQEERVRLSQNAAVDSASTADELVLTSSPSSALDDDHAHPPSELVDAYLMQLDDGELDASSSAAHGESTAANVRGDGAVTASNNV